MTHYQFSVLEHVKRSGGSVYRSTLPVQTYRVLERLGMLAELPSGRVSLTTMGEVAVSSYRRGQEQRRSLA